MFDSVFMKGIGMRKYIKAIRAKSPAARKKSGGKDTGPKDFPDQVKEAPFLSPELDINLARIKEIFKDCSDILYREFLFAQREDIRLALIYADGLLIKISSASKSCAPWPWRCRWPHPASISQKPGPII